MSGFSHSTAHICVESFQSRLSPQIIIFVSVIICQMRCYQLERDGELWREGEGLSKYRAEHVLITDFIYEAGHCTMKNIPDMSAVYHTLANRISV